MTPQLGADLKPGSQTTTWQLSAAQQKEVTRYSDESDVMDSGIELGGMTESIRLSLPSGAAVMAENLDAVGDPQREMFRALTMGS